MKVIALIQARMGSTRLPGKVMKLIQGTPMVELLLKRLSPSQEIDQIVVATSINKENKILLDHVKCLGFEVFQGDEEDVLDRFHNAALHCNAETIVRITADCPLTDYRLVDSIIAQYRSCDVLDYMSNTQPPTYPDGLDVEVFSFDALNRAHKLVEKPSEREHVTPFIRNANGFKRGNFKYDSDLSPFRWTVDEPSDFEVIKNIFNYFHPIIDFSWLEVLALSKTHPELFVSNQGIKRNEGYEKSLKEDNLKEDKH